MPTEISPAPTGSSGPRRRVLVIDDSALVREAARVALARAGWEVLAAESGERGVALVREERPDVILLDLVMPEMGGAAVAERLLTDSATCAIPIVLLTAEDRGEERARLERLGVSGMIAKPFDLSALADQLGALLERAR